MAKEKKKLNNALKLRSNAAFIEFTMQLPSTMLLLVAKYDVSSYLAN